MGAGLNAERDKGTGKGVDVIAEFAVGSRIVEGGVLKSILVGKILRHTVENFRESFVDQGVFLPDEFAGMRLIVIEGFFALGGIAEGSNHVPKLRQNHFHVGQFGTPRRIPNERQKTVVVDGAQSRHHIGKGEFSFAEEAVFDAVADFFGIVDMHVANVSTEVFDNLLGRFAAFEIGDGKVPKSGEMVRSEVLEKIAQNGCFSKRTGSLNQEGNASLLSAIQH